jgi:hypothetical protein
MSVIKALACAVVLAISAVPVAALAHGRWDGDDWGPSFGLVIGGPAYYPGPVVEDSEYYGPPAYYYYDAPYYEPGWRREVDWRRYHTHHHYYRHVVYRYAHTDRRPLRRWCGCG